MGTAAARRRAGWVLAALLAAGCCTARGMTLHRAARHLLSKGAKADIFSAAALGMAERVRTLLDAYGDAVHVRALGWTPLHFAPWGRPWIATGLLTASPGAECSDTSGV